ncbi:MAG: PAS domain-containing sensor histidine kinase [Candidatus Methylomirabilales bacterium]
MSRHLAALLPRRRLGLRLFLVLAAAILVIALAADAWRLRQARARVLAQLQREASLVTQAIQGQVASLLGAEDAPRLAGLLEDVRQAKDAECVGVYSLEGRRVRATFEPGAAQRGPDVCPPEIVPVAVAEVVSAQWGLSGTYNLQLLLAPDDVPQGVLKLVFDAARVSGPLEEFRNSILVERVLVLLAMGVTLWIGIALSVTRPIRRLIAGADEIGRGNLEARIPSPGETEIGELARAFNRMAERLAEAQEERGRAEESRAVMERQLRHAERLAAVGKLASVIAHEVGTPLHVIAGRARNLGRGLSPDDPRQADVEAIREQVGRITRTMQQVLQSSRAIPARREDVDLGQLVRDVAGIVGPEYAARSVRLVLSLPEGLPAVPADADGLTQVLLNLLTNALAATPAGGRVEVGGAAGVRDGRPGVVLAVTDTGTGIPAEHLDRIFDPFFSTKRSGGTGLGLSICRDIVRAHAGAITVESAPGAGARFSIWLPGDRREARCA